MTEISDIKTASIIPIGNEILSGKTLDKNSNWIAAKLSEHGIRLQQIRVIPDDKNRIVATVNELRARYNIVITTGGIGPTHDDITAESIADAFGRNLVRHPQAYETLKSFYGEENLNSGRLKMAMIPEGASLIDNPVSGAPGFRVDNVYVLAGVPDIMKAMMTQVLNDIVPGQPFLSKIIACPLPESRISEALEDIQNTFPDIDIGSYPSYRDGTYRVNIIARGQIEQDLMDVEAAVKKMLECHGAASGEKTEGDSDVFKTDLF